ncbi:MAG: AMP-binding protein [Acidobacteriota bacterium]|jgi:acetyl-CoA synthetase|nr:AMP-binding protein [Acidobacteriota bacterium]
MLNLHKRYVSESYDAQGVLQGFSIHCPEDYNFAYDVVDAVAAAEPGRPAMVWLNPEGEEHLFSYGDLKLWSDKAANFLASAGVRRGDVVLVILRRHYQFWFAALALHKLGAVLAPATFMLKEHDLRYRLDRAQVRTVVCTDAGDVAGVVDAVDRGRGGGLVKILVGGGGGGLTPPEEIAELLRRGAGEGAGGAGFDPFSAKGAALGGPQGICSARVRREGWLDFNQGVAEASGDFARVPTKASDPMIMYFSSGTSGPPKMVLHDSGYSLGHLGTAKHWQNVRGDGGLHLTIADTGWGKAVWGKFYGQFLLAACVLTYDFDRFRGEEVCALIERFRVSTFCAPPTMVRLILQSGSESYDLSSLEYSVTAGEALSPELFERWKARTGLALMDGFGQTETPVTVCNRVGMAPRPGSMGKPLPLYDIKIMDADGRECADGQTGEICIKADPRPPGVMVGYLRDEAKTAEAMRGGWYHTGDTAWRDEDGYYWYVGRNDDIIKSSGYRIGPFEIESVLHGHPAVRECAVTGVPDPVRGTAVKATIVLNPGFEGSEALTKELQEWVKAQTAPYKFPRIVAYADALPKTVNGKIRRAAIRDADGR